MPSGCGPSSGIPDKARIRISGLAQPVSLADDHQGMLFKRRNDRSYGINGTRFLPAGLRDRRSY